MINQPKSDPAAHPRPVLLGGPYTSPLSTCLVGGHGVVLARRLELPPVLPPAQLLGHEAHQGVAIVDVEVAMVLGWLDGGGSAVAAALRSVPTPLDDLRLILHLRERGGAGQQRGQRQRSTDQTHCRFDAEVKRQPVHGWGGGAC